MYQGENRRQTVNYLIEVMDQAYSEFELQVSEQAMSLLLHALQGMARLQFTYAQDHVLVAEIRAYCEAYSERVLLLWENNRCPVVEAVTKKYM